MQCVLPLYRIYNRCADLVAVGSENEDIMEKGYTKLLTIGRSVAWLYRNNITNIIKIIKVL